MNVDLNTHNTTRHYSLVFAEGQTRSEHYIYIWTPSLLAPPVSILLHPLAWNVVGGAQLIKFQKKTLYFWKLKVHVGDKPEVEVRSFWSQTQSCVRQSGDIRWEGPSQSLMDTAIHVLTVSEDEVGWCSIEVWRPVNKDQGWQLQRVMWPSDL